ncbi:MAG: RNA 2',3'-cyclic phosphodiesterase [Candidatus Acidiferrales bacterium]|jgi:2'-5' RNA ligase
MRLFVALDFPDGVRDAVRELIAALKPLCKGARWMRPEAMHITLKFIGYTKEENLGPIYEALGQVHSDAAVEMRFRGVGFFPNERHPRVAWCGIESSKNLGELAADIESALELLGIERERREFAAHLTLARFESPSSTRELVDKAEEMKTLDFGATRETEFHLYESTLKPSGSEYRKVASFPFVKGAARQ